MMTKGKKKKDVLLSSYFLRRAFLINLPSFPLPISKATPVVKRPWLVGGAWTMEPAKLVCWLVCWPKTKEGVDPIKLVGPGICWLDWPKVNWAEEPELLVCRVWPKTKEGVDLVKPDGLVCVADPNTKEGVDPVKLDWPAVWGFDWPNAKVGVEPIKPDWLVCWLVCPKAKEGAVELVKLDWLLWPKANVGVEVVKLVCVLDFPKTKEGVEPVKLDWQVWLVDWPKARAVEPDWLVCVLDWPKAKEGVEPVKADLLVWPNVNDEAALEGAPKLEPVCPEAPDSVPVLLLLLSPVWLAEGLLDPNSNKPDWDGGGGRGCLIWNPEEVCVWWGGGGGIII